VSDDSAIPFEVLRKRRDFLAAARAGYTTRPGLTLQARKRPAGEAGEAMRVGFTCSKKVGNAVLRNRAKRRLRALAGAVLPSMGRAGWDYVLIGRRNETVNRPFALLHADLCAALHKLHNAPFR